MPCHCLSSIAGERPLNAAQERGYAAKAGNEGWLARRCTAAGVAGAWRHAAAGGCGRQSWKLKHGGTLPLEVAAQAHGRDF